MARHCARTDRSARRCRSLAADIQGARHGIPLSRDSAPCLDGAGAIAVVPTNEIETRGRGSASRMG